MELYKDIIKNYTTLIVAGGIIYSNTHHSLIPLVQYNDGVYWVHLDATVISDLKRVLKRLKSLGATWFYRTKSLDFNVEIGTTDFHKENFSGLLLFEFRSNFYHIIITPSNMEILDIPTKLIEITSYYKNSELLLEAIDCLSVPQKFRVGHRILQLNDKDGRLTNMRRSLAINLILE